MANFTQVNKAIKAKFPKLDVVAVRGDAYVYFVGRDGEEIESLFVHPVNTKTADMIEYCIEQVADLVDK